MMFHSQLNVVNWVKKGVGCCVGVKAQDCYTWVLSSGRVVAQVRPEFNLLYLAQPFISLCFISPGNLYYMFLHNF